MSPPTASIMWLEVMLVPSLIYEKLLNACEGYNHNPHDDILIILRCSVWLRFDAAKDLQYVSVRMSVSNAVVFGNPCFTTFE